MQITWSPEYRHFPLTEGFVALFSETQVLRLTSDLYELIHQVVKAGSSVYQVDGLDFYTNLRFVAETENLVAQRVLLHCNDAKLTSLAGQEHWPVPDFTSPYRRLFVTPQNNEQSAQNRHIHFSLLHCKHMDALLLSATNQIDNADINTQQIALVWLDDFFDPRLNQLFEQLEKGQLPAKYLLPVKITGKRKLVGPLLAKTTDSTNAPCLHCLLSHLQANQPVRFWLDAIKPRQELAATLCAPLRYAPADIQATARFIWQQVIPDIVARPEMAQQYLVEITDDGTSQTHAVKRLPDCSHCGDEQMFVKQCDTPINLALVGDANARIVSRDNGFRVKAAADTLRELKPLVSPVCGLIQYLEPLPASSPETAAEKHEVPIYQSMYFNQVRSIAAANAQIQVQQDVFSNYCLGKGLNSQQSQVSALCEAFERRNALYRGNEPYLHTTPEALPNKAWLPQQLAPFSAYQYNNFAQLSVSDRKAQHGVLPYTPEKAIAWTQAWRLADASACYLPTHYCFKNAPVPGAEYIHWGSNGCAAGNNIAEAILQGCLEVIERDAVAIWWYNRIALPAYPLQNLSANSRELFHHQLSSQWQYWLLDATNDLGIPVILAIGKQHNSDKFVLGFGCHLSHQIAAERALSELCQLIPIREQNIKRFNFDDIQPEPFLFANAEGADSYAPWLENTSQSLNCAIEHLVSHLQSKQLEVIVLNYSRPEVNLATVNVSIPGTCHIWPQQACERLYQTPITQQWLPRPLTESQLNPLNLWL